MKKFYVLALLLLVSSSAFAYDDLVTTQFHPFVTAPGSFHVGGGLVYLTASDRFDMDGDSQALADDATNLRIPLNASYGIIDCLDAFVLVPIVSLDDGMDSESGIGDVWIGARYAVLMENMLTLRAALNIGTGDDDKGLGNMGGVGVDINAVHQKSIIEDKLGVRAQLGLRYAVEDSDTKRQPGIGVYVTGGVGYCVAEKTWLQGGLELITYGEYKNDGDDVSDSNMTALELILGGTREINEQFGLGAHLSYTLLGTNAYTDLGINIHCGYNF